MKEDVLVCPFCGHHSRSKLTTNISDDALVSCNYCENQFKMQQARVAPLPDPKQRLRRRLPSQLTKAKKASSKPSVTQLRAQEVEDETDAIERNELALAAFITSLVAFLLAGCLSPISLVFAIVALEKRPRGLATAALVLSLAGLVPMTTVALPFFATRVLNAIDTKEVLVQESIGEQRASDESPESSEAQGESPEQPSAQVVARQPEPTAGSPSAAPPTEEEPAEQPALLLTAIRQQYKPFSSIKIYMMAENVSNKPISGFEAIIRFTDKNGAVAAQDKLSKIFREPMAPGERRSVLLGPEVRSELRALVPDDCRGSATVLKVH